MGGSSRGGSVRRFELADRRQITGSAETLVSSEPFFWSVSEEEHETKLSVGGGRAFGILSGAESKRAMADDGKRPPALDVS